MTILREERASDADGVRRVNEEAFGRAGEADIVEDVRRRGAVTLSLVAEVDGAVVGHILFSRAEIGHAAFTGTAVGLAPMAVLPAFQNRGIGSALVREGLERCRGAGHAAAVVLGHPEFYPRFGFAPAVTFGLSSEYPVPDEVFMAQELVPGALAGAQGLVVYDEAFRESESGPPPRS